MNILIINDDGPSFGLDLLRDAAKARWRDANIVAIVPKADASASGTSAKASDFARVKTKKLGPKLFEAAGATPLDIVNHAFVCREKYAKQPWNLVLSGVNDGANVGLGVLTSGTVMPLVYAARAFDVPCWAFSQETPKGFRTEKADAAENRSAFRNAARYLPQFLRNKAPDFQVGGGGECFAVNFPDGASTKGWMNTEVSYFNPRVGPGFLPVREQREKGDVAFLAEGYTTIAEVALSLSPPARY